MRKEESEASRSGGMEVKKEWRKEGMEVRENGEKEVWRYGGTEERKNGGEKDGGKKKWRKEKMEEWR